MKNAIVVVVDRLGAGYLGPYGNTWIETPNFNRLAAEALLFEFAMADSPRLPMLYRSYWKGQHAMSGDAAAESLPESLAACELHTALVTDDCEVADLQWAGGFDERIALPPVPVTEAAQDTSQTQMAQLFATAAGWLERAPEPFLLWIHSQGMEGPWDAPLDFRNQFADEEDPLPPEFVAPPVRRLDAGYDPDELLGVQHAYAGQVCLLDICLGALVDAVESMAGQQNALLMLTSPRGYPLGEHGRIGACDDSLYGEQLHVPCFIRFPDGAGAATRSQHLVQPPDVLATLLDWLGMPTNSPLVWCSSMLSAVENVRPPLRDRACAIAEGHSAIRTPAWFLHRHPNLKRELFAKPDDRWEANEVADLCQETVGELEAYLDEFQQAVQSGEPDRLTPLPKMLIEGLE